MPVKIRCSSCQKVLSVADSARGKVVKCPGCESKIRVPAGEESGESSSATASSARTAARAGAKSGAKKAVRKEASDEDFLSDLDLNRMEDTSSRVCPKCGTETSFEDLECPKCGIEFTTGQLSAKAARRKGMRGPDPAEFYSVVWSDSWKFMRSNMHLVWRTGFYSTLFMWLALNCLLVAVFLCENIPPRVFWLCMSGLFALGVPGWYWLLNGRVIEITMNKEKKLKKLGFDFLLNVALGFKSLIWPIALILPFCFIPGAQLLPALAYPVAQVHMQQRHVWPAWSFWHMLQATFRNIGPVLYFHVVAIAASLCVSLPAGGLGALFALNQDALVSVLEMAARANAWVLEMAGESPTDPGFIAYVLISLNTMVATFLILAPFGFAAAFPTVYITRANGLFAYYNRENLELVTEIKPNVLGGFWPRYLAYMIDGVVIGAAGGIVYGLTLAAMYFLSMLGMVGMAITLWSAAGLGMSVFTLLYFAKSESGPTQATIGKRAIGLIVQTEDAKMITLSQGFSRAFGRGLSGTLFGIGFIIAAFTPKKQTLHDMLTKTMVIFKGDDEASMRG